MKGSHFDQPEHINPDKLNEELKTALGAVFDSVDTGVKLTRDPAEKPKIFVRVSNDATEADIEKVEGVLAAHKHTELSISQRREKSRIDAFMRVKDYDFKSLRSKNKELKIDAVIDLLEDIQQLMREAEHG